MIHDKNTKLIAKNTITLYLRMFIMLLIGLYTSRVILNVLGVVDYGIYNIVGGLVGLFAIISSSLSSSVSRYLTFEIGKGNVTRLKDIFSISLTAQLCMALFIVLLIEIVGVWYLHNKMNLPVERIEVATFVFHCSVVSFTIGIVMIPYNAVIIAHERFGVYAYITLFDAFMKLIIAFAISVSPCDKLKTYAFLLLCVAVFVQFFYFVYGNRQFEECKFRLSYNKQLFKEFGGFAGWSFLGNTSWILNSQGIDLLINLSFGITLNTARAIANQVNNLVNGFVTNFMMALNPQITKSYALNDLQHMHRLIYAGAKYSYFLILFFSIPLILETEQLLVLWLKIVPEYAVPFVRLTLVATMVFVLGNTLTTAQSSTGKVKKYAVVTSLLTFAEFPLVYVFFRMGFSPISCYVVHICVYGLLIFVKIHLVKGLIQISYGAFVEEVLIRAFVVTICSLIIPVIVYLVFPTSIYRLLILLLASCLSSTFIMLYLGMKDKERVVLLSYVKMLILKR